MFCAANVRSARYVKKKKNNKPTYLVGMRNIMQSSVILGKNLFKSREFSSYICM